MHGEGVRDTRAQVPRCAAHVRERGDDGAQEIERCVGPPVGQRRFRQRPDPFVRVELGRVRREILEPQASMPREQRPNHRPLMRFAVVPQDDDGAGEMSEQVLEKAGCGDRANVLGMTLEIEPAPPAQGAHRDAGDDRDAIVAVPVAEDRGLAARCPRPPHGRRDQEARFVDEDEVGAQPRGVFFTRAQSRVFHRAIAASSRWSARRSGFCGVQPSWWSRRPT